MPLKLVIVTDIHYHTEDINTRRGSLGDVLLQRAVYRINRLIRPDAVVFLGDLMDEGEGPEAPRLRQQLAQIATQVEMPSIVLPGNHDGAPRSFYRDFARPRDWLDIKGYRLLPFIDIEEPGHNARRPPENLQRMLDARAGFKGPIVQLQHTSLFPDNTAHCPYNYTNVDDVIERMRKADIRFSISGHFHKGTDCIKTDEGAFVMAMALCEPPFIITEIDIDGEQVRATRHALQMPLELKLSDLHIHTQLAYCAKNMDIVKAIELAEAFGLDQMGFSEHSGQLYFNRKDYWSGSCLTMGTDRARSSDNRMADYLETLAMLAPRARVGFEVDCDFQGNPLLKDCDRARVEYLLGAMHVLPSLRKDRCDPAKAEDEFLAILSKFITCGIDILAHPFRVFRRAGLPIPQRLFPPVVRLLKQHGVAAEINFHINEPDPEFVTQCLAAGVRLSFGSDAHDLAEIGDFALHLDLLRRCGCQDPRETLVAP